MQPENSGSFKALARSSATSLIQWPLLIVLGIVAIGLVLVVVGHWRRGTVLIGAALGVGAGLRAFLPPHQVGLLQVRSRPIDVTFLLGCAAAIIVLSLAVPTP